VEQKWSAEKGENISVRGRRGLRQEDVFVQSIYTFNPKIDIFHEKWINEIMCCKDKMDPHQETISTNLHLPTSSAFYPTWTNAALSVG
jgi:hypothetical protein